jgi:hypothetical protein
MTAFSINQTLISTWRMTFHGRFLPHAPQHHRMLRQGPPNGKNRPFLVSCDVVTQRPLPAKAATQFQATDWY